MLEFFVFIVIIAVAIVLYNKHIGNSNSNINTELRQVNIDNAEKYIMQRAIEGHYNKFTEKMQKNIILWQWQPHFNP